jgi:hypothetical protein
MEAIMRKIFLCMLLFTILSGIYAQNSVSTGIDISFTFNRRTDFASNQFAVWIEDSQGKMVRTLFATRYTATGGWEKRPLSIPLWVRQSGLSTLSKEEIDAFTGATPRAGALTYRWDGLDTNGRRMAAGEYQVFLEATLKDENRVLYSAPITLGGSTGLETIIRTKYTGKSTRERKLIQDVRVFYRP